MTQEESKDKPFGRPTLYKPEYCQMLIDHMSSGRSFESFAAKLSVSKQTIYDWTRNNEDFLDAFNVGRQKHFSYMEELAMNHMVEEFQSSKLNTGLYRLFMANIHGWREKEESKQQEVKPIRVAYVPLSQRKPKE